MDRAEIEAHLSERSSAISVKVPFSRGGPDRNVGTGQGTYVRAAQSLDDDVVHCGGQRYA